ncbi:MAG: zinc ribbon domain-containing protein [Acidobacteriota bacterium]
MFCPKCGSNQGDGKKFCTVCGTNLLIVSQALTGQLPSQLPQPAVHYAPPVVTQQELERQQEMRSGITMTVLGGGYIIYKLISFLFALPFGGWRSPFGFLSFIAFIVFAVGISKIVASRVAGPPPATLPATTVPSRAPQPQPRFSSVSTAETVAPRTSELKPVRLPSTSVTEEETKHLTH